VLPLVGGTEFYFPILRSVQGVENLEANFAAFASTIQIASRNNNIMIDRRAVEN
jgi:hypothetical protein